MELLCLVTYRFTHAIHGIAVSGDVVQGGIKFALAGLLEGASVCQLSLVDTLELLLR